MSRKVLSKRKLAANRANARKSTGPRTPSGKARSSLNALKHGFFADTVVLPGDKTESIDDFHALCDALRAEFAPVGPLEDILVERLAATYWRLRRTQRFEVLSILDLREWCESPEAEATRKVQGFTTPHPPAQFPPEAVFDRIFRFESMLDRTVHRVTTQHLGRRAFALPPWRE